jgi:hypothetical protein
MTKFIYPLTYILYFSILPFKANGRNKNYFLVFRREAMNKISFPTLNKWRKQFSFFFIFEKNKIPSVPLDKWWKKLSVFLLWEKKTSRVNIF